MVLYTHARFFKKKLGFQRFQNNKKSLPQKKKCNPSEKNNLLGSFINSNFVWLFQFEKNNAAFFFLSLCHLLRTKTFFFFLQFLKKKRARQNLHTKKKTKALCFTLNNKKKRANFLRSQTLFIPSIKVAPPVRFLFQEL